MVNLRSSSVAFPGRQLRVYGTSTALQQGQRWRRILLESPAFLCLAPRFPTRRRLAGSPLASSEGRRWPPSLEVTVAGLGQGCPLSAP